MGVLKDLLELLEKWARANHYPDWMVDYAINLLIPFIFLLVTLYWLYKLIITLFAYRNKKILNSQLHPYYSGYDVFNATRYFINTKFQNISPDEEDEPSRNFIASAKDKLIPLLIKKVFRNTKNHGKHYLILADSGMGKTTFLINLFIKYKKTINYPWSPKKSNIKLVPLAYANCVDSISKIEEKGNTILLLDSFDENVQAAENYKIKLEEILRVSYDFKAVILTCRTQFFPNQHEEPYDTGYFSFGESGEYKFQKIYISPFSNKDIARYLLMKYNILNPFRLRKLIKAHAIVRKCSNLMVRPMLLKHINDLVGTKKVFTHSYQIYEVLVTQWIKREANKPSIKRKYGSPQKYERLLLNFSGALALDLYRNREKRGGYFLNKDEDFNVEGLSLAAIDEERTKLSLFEKRSQSLLNRNAEGQYKFSHKSIFEYFLANQIIKKRLYNESKSILGNDVTLVFFNDIVAGILKTAEGLFSLVDQNEYVPFTLIRGSDIPLVKHVFIGRYSDFDPALLNLFSSLKTLIVSDTYAFPGLYSLYQKYLDFFEDSGWSRYHTDSRAKEYLSNHYLFSISNRISEKRYPLIKAYYKYLEDSTLIIEHYVLPGNPAFQTHISDRKERIKNYTKLWEQKKMLLRLIKQIMPRPNRKVLEKQTKGDTSLEEFFKEILELKDENKNWEIYY